MLDGIVIALISLFFCFGYLLIISESFFSINKATTALLLGSLLWVIILIAQGCNPESSVYNLQTHYLSICEFLFFLWGAMVIVEIINAHQGLDWLGRLFAVDSKKQRLWLIGIFAFFLSAILDNLTTTIVLITILRKICSDLEERKILAVAVVIAANAGGAWTPIGDVTTTMLWIGGQVSTIGLIKSLFLPSVACLFVALFYFSFYVTGSLHTPQHHVHTHHASLKSIFMAVIGFLGLIAVPILKLSIGLPPAMGMLLSMGLVGVISDIAKPIENKERVPFHEIIHRVDTSIIFFFLGILLSVDALETAGILHHIEVGLGEVFTHLEMIPFAIGIISAIIDNVPLVAASMGMYTPEIFPKDSQFWHLIAYCAGVGGNLLIIGSAAGVAFMSMEKATFFWYVRRATIPAFLSYAVGFLVALWTNS